MKADEIRQGMRVGVVRAGRNRPLVGRGIVMNVHTKSGRYSSRVQTYADVHHHDKDWNPEDADRWDIETKRLVKTDEPLVCEHRIQELISESDLNARVAAKDEAVKETARRQAMVNAVQEGIEASLVRAGIDLSNFIVMARYRPATDEEAEGVIINSVTFRTNGVQQLQNFISRELELIDQES